MQQNFYLEFWLPVL